jgi:tripartite-type tricarboxylate transporter receptor subunit TctC
MRLRLRSPLCVAAALALLLFAPSVSAQQYPSKVVKLIVPQAPGGATDVFARAIGQKLSERWGQPVVVENRAGAAGNIGTDAVAKSPADGYTLLVTYAGSQAINPALYANMPYDSVKDFQPIATLASTPFFLITHPSVPAKTLKELIALSKSKPDGLSFASSGNGSVNHLLAEMLKAESGFRYVHVPYKGVSQAITDVLGGQVETSFASVPSVLQTVRSGNVRAIAVSSGRRIAVAPDVPTIAEAGFPGYDVNPWWGMLAPAGTDMAIVNKINADVAEILKTPEMDKILGSKGAEPFVNSPDEFLKILKADVEKWAKVVKAAGVKIN